MPPSHEFSSIVTLMAGFVGLAPAQQRVFLEALNGYLFASPAVRKRMRGRWRASAAEASEVSGAVPEAPSPAPQGAEE